MNHGREMAVLADLVHRELPHVFEKQSFGPVAGAIGGAAVGGIGTALLKRYLSQKYKIKNKNSGPQIMMGAALGGVAGAGIGYRGWDMTRPVKDTDVNITNGTSLADVKNDIEAKNYRPDSSDWKVLAGNVGNFTTNHPVITGETGMALAGKAAGGLAGKIGGIPGLGNKVMVGQSVVRALWNSLVEVPSKYRTRQALLAEYERLKAAK